MEAKKEKGSRFLRIIEKVGNALPNPAIIFVLMCVLVIIVSYMAQKAGLKESYFDAKIGENVTKEAVSLMNKEGLAYIFNSMLQNFMHFEPLGTVLVAMFGVGVAEWSGLFSATLKKVLGSVNPKFLTPVVVFTGIMSNIASDAGYVVVIPLAAGLFAMAGRHPLAGLAAGFAGVSGGFSANLLIGTTDPLLTGITNAALVSGGIDMSLNPTCNWYFLSVSCIILTVVGTFVTNKIVEPSLGEYNNEYEFNKNPLSKEELIGLKKAGISLIIFLIIMGGLMFMPNGAFQTLDPKTKTLNLNHFLHSGLIPGIMLMFLIPGYVYGRSIKKIKGSNDLVEGMVFAMRSMSGYMVLAFFASQFIAFFAKTNLGVILSINGARLLESINLKGLPLILLFILLSAILNLFMGSASAKWAIMAPVFIPMMTQLGLSPALTQVAFRIGDSCTNIITPLMSYFAMIVVFMQRYDKKAGLGTLTSMMLPYTVFFLIFWTILMILWVLLNLPLGPETPIFLK